MALKDHFLHVKFQSNIVCKWKGLAKGGDAKNKSKILDDS